MPILDQENNLKENPLHRFSLILWNAGSKGRPNQETGGEWSRKGLSWNSGNRNLSLYRQPLGLLTEVITESSANRRKISTSHIEYLGGFILDKLLFFWNICIYYWKINNPICYFFYDIGWLDGSIQLYHSHIFWGWLKRVFPKTGKPLQATWNWPSSCRRGFLV